MTTQSPESFVQISPDSIGKKIRNLTVIATEVDPVTGAISTATVQMNAVVVIDAVTGQPAELLMKSDLEETNRLLRAVVRGLELMTDETLLDQEEV
jgi:hypothetical protein